MVIIQRNSLALGQQLLDHFPITVIQGARQVGKSTLAQLLVQNREHRVVSLDDPLNLHAARTDPHAFVRMAGQGTLVIDEAQLDGALTRTLKLAVDADRRPGQFILTGSANMLRMRSDSDSLAGRAVSLHLHGLSQGELHSDHEDFVSVVLEGPDPDTASSTMERGDYIARITLGGFPEMQQEMSQRLRNAWLDSYVERVLERDAPIIPSGRSTIRLRSVLRLIAANHGGELVKARIAEQANLPAASITPYLDALEAVYLIDHLQPWTPNLTRREIGRTKTFVTDSALALRLAGLTPQQLEPLTSDHFGHHLEAFVASELMKQQSWSATDYQLRHYRDRDGLEVDLVIETPEGRVIAIEVKSASSFRPEHFTNLLKLKDRLGDRFLRGIVLSTASRGRQYTHGLWGLPVSTLWAWRA